MLNRRDPSEFLRNMAGFGGMAAGCEMAVLGTSMRVGSFGDRLRPPPVHTAVVRHDDRLAGPVGKLEQDAAAGR